MARQPETRDRFRITADIEVDQLGTVVAQLIKMGLQNLHHELITDVVQFGKNGRHDTSSQEFAMEWIADNPTFRMTELSKHFEISGRNKNTAHYAIKRLTDEGVTIKLGEGQYRRADVKEIAPPKPAGSRSRPAPPGRYDVSNKTLLSEFLGQKKSFAISGVTAFFKERDRPPNSATSIVAKLAKEGFLKSIGEGRYEVLKKPAKDTVSKLNGSQDGAAAHV